MNRRPAAALVGWIVDAQRDFADPGGRLDVRDAASATEEAAPDIIPALTRAVDVFKGNPACGSFLREVEEVMDLPLDVIVAGMARDRSVTLAVDGLLARGHQAIVVRDAVCGVGLDLEKETQSRWDGKVTVVSAAALYSWTTTPPVGGRTCTTCW